ncbi:MAG: DegV family EDD domain-containing protein [Thermoanaerobaculum sp.]|nr:DegV family EDD domain-containing protein [Thermoanaerobaculum sp.]MDW7968235.1 DegV family protein [Thermoanaerobaculum sp.]
MVQVLTGPRFVRAVRAGSLAVVRQQEAINRINVFPVPDADTGTNLASTLRVAATAVQLPPLAVGQAVRKVADAALEGARGNSGAIMAQFFHGLAEALQSHVRCTAVEFAQAVRRAAEGAHQAMAHPVEGTILSVLKAWAEEVEAGVREGVRDFGELLARSLKCARQALARTQEQLEVLRKNKVVDAGAQGFVCFLEGVVGFFRDRRAADWRQVGLSFSCDDTPFAAAHAEMQTSFRFCSEALLTGERLDRKTVARLIEPLGDSLVVAGGGSRLRVHLHTNEPQRLFALLATVGAVARTKIEDMILQQLMHRSPYRVGLVTDSSCDLPESTLAVTPMVRVPLHILFGEESFADGVDITPAQFYQRLASSPVAPKTSQPAVGEYRRVFQRLLERHEGVVCVTLSSGLSGTYQAALAAAREVDPQRVRVVDSKGLSVTLGLVMEAVVARAAAGAGLDEVAATAQEVASQTKLFAAIPSLETAARSGRVSPGLARMSKVFHLRPILTLDEHGKAAKAGVRLGFASCLRGLVQKAVRFAQGSPVRLMVAHANAIGAAQYVADRLCQAFGVEDIPVVNLSPVLAAHTGPGSVGIAVRRLTPLVSSGGAI